MIVSEEKQKTEEKPKNNRNDVGFVERKKKQDEEGKKIRCPLRNPCSYPFSKGKGKGESKA